MKLIDLINKIDGDVNIFVNGKRLTEELTEEVLEAKITKIDIETKKAANKGLEELSYSFEVGV
ncbi:MAG: hypothetical protein KGZ96_07740 [Clostridia bacterium]|jgi:hypothetical protein|nr:hypothetical protein [Clostridia bacterium]